MRIIGYAFDGELYHEECLSPLPESNGHGPNPVFSTDEISEDDYCKHCVDEFIHNNPGKNCPDYVYILER